jgi:uncharacterized membrane protein YjgN (DUF898 family)
LHHVFILDNLCATPSKPTESGNLLRPGGPSIVQPVTCHYSLLGVAVDASTEEIATAYARALSRFKRRLAEGNPLPLEHLDAIRTAHRVLIEPGSRADYDRLHAPAPAAPLAMAAQPVRPEVAVNAPADTDDEAHVEFRGDGGEYLRIWLVNVALSVLTLGIYSAWAKVRREQYFHRNLVVDGAAFDYHGAPRAILIGRILLVVMLVLMNLSEGFHPAAHLAASVAAMLGFPWLMLRSLQFRARNTSYRGLRFSFDARYGEALKLYLLHGFLTGITLGLYFPAFLRHQKAFVARHLRFGNLRCEFDAGVAAFYRGLALPLVLWLLIPVAFIVMSVMIAAMGKGAAMLMVILVPLLFFAFVLLANLVLAPYVRVVGTNLLWNHLSLGDTRFRSTQTIGSYLKLVLGNWLLTMLTLGFYWPIAQIKVARYRAAHLTVLAPGALTDAIAAQGEAPAAFGDEVVESFDFDIAL